MKIVLLAALDAMAAVAFTINLVGFALTAQLRWRRPGRWSDRRSRRDLLIAGAIVLATGAVMLASTVLIAFAQNLSGFALPLFATTAVGLIAGTIITVRIARASFRDYAMLRDAKLLVCVECGHRLDHGVESGACPECGAAYEVESLRQKWRETTFPEAAAEAAEGTRASQ